MSTKFHRRGILLTRNSPCQHVNPPLTHNSPVGTEFCQHGIPSTRNSVTTEFRQHGIPSTRNSVNMEFHQHLIPSTRNFADTEFRIIFYFRIFGMLCYAIYFVPTLTEFRIQKKRNSVEFHGIPRILKASLQYV